MYIHKMCLSRIILSTTCFDRCRYHLQGSLQEY